MQEAKASFNGYFRSQLCQQKALTFVALQVDLLICKGSAGRVFRKMKLAFRVDLGRGIRTAHELNRTQIDEEIVHRFMRVWVDLRSVGGD